MRAVGADAHIGPMGSYEFAVNFRKNGAFCRADVGIGPYGFMGSLCKKPERRPGLRSGKEETVLENKKPKRKFSLRFGKEEADSENKRLRFAKTRFVEAASDAVPAKAVRVQL